MNAKRSATGCTRRAARLGVLLFMVVQLGAPGAGCGYQVVGYRSGGQDPIRVSVQTLSNDTLQPGIELIVTEALRRAFLHAGRLRLVEDPATADYRLSGRVAEVVTVGRSFSQNVRALEFSVTLRLALDLTRADAAEGASPRLHPQGLAETELYLASADIEVSRKNRDEALRRLAKLLADRVYDEVQLVTDRATAAARERGTGTP